MKTKEMIIDVTVKLNKLNGNSTKRLQDEEIIWYLNDAQYELIRNNIRPDNTNGFYEIDEINQELFTNILKGSFVNKNNSGNFEIPDDCYILLSGEVKVDNRKLKLNKIKSNLASTINNLPFYKGNTTFVNVLQFSNTLKIQSDSVDFKQIYLLYITKPPTITITDDCKLKEFYHILISELAQQNITASSGDSEKYRLKRENNKNQLLIN